MSQVYPFWRKLMLFWCLLPSVVFAQQFINSDLNGAVAISSTPTSWQSVSMNDIHCNATQALYATADVTSMVGPNAGVGINGNPFSGTTFVTGLDMTSGGSYWHEGIQQTISGFTIGQVYNIRFYQTLVKQSNALDQSGQWLVIRDNTVLGTSSTVFSSLPYSSTSLSWSQFDISFSATSTTHTFKFLPHDNDNNHSTSNEAIRMGIDQISLTTSVILPWTAELSLSRKDDAVQLDWEMPEAGATQTFAIERSADGIHFESVERIAADYIGDYQTYDYYPYDDISYYRLAQIGADGSARYSNVESISMALPLTGHIGGRRVLIRGAQPGPCHVELIDLQGRIVYTNPQVENETQLTGIKRGIYILRIRQGDQLFQEKFHLE